MTKTFFKKTALASLLAFMTLIARAEDPAKFKVGEFDFARPAAWKWTPIQPGMRKAQLAVVDEKSGAKAEVIFFHFGPGQGGDAKANIDRWLSQFQEGADKINAKIEPVTIGKGKITYVSAEGTYLSGMPGGPKIPLPDAALQGAIVESTEGNVFIRMTGPKALVIASAKAFKEMVESPLK